MDLERAEIDWIAGLNASVQIERRNTLYGEDGIQLSDHPLLAAGVSF